MIQSELRVGNITDKGVIKNFWEKGVHVGFGKCYEFTELNPIPLTEEWLFKFGYIKIRNNYLIQGNCIWICNDLFICDKNGTVLKSVHQLQNLYWCLCEKELIYENENEN